MIQASGSMAALMRVARRSRTGCHSQGLWLTNCWEALLVAAFEARRHGLDRLAAPVEHQAAQVGLAPAALVAARQRAEHLRREGTSSPRALASSAGFMSFASLAW